MIDKMFEIGLLYDFYSELLTPHQKRISQLYFEDNYTLAEIADVTGVSRQAVHDVIRRCTRTLEEYESKLRLMEKFLHIKGSAEEILKLACREEGTAVEETMERIRVLSTDILEEL